VWTDTREGHQDVYTSIVDTTFAGVPEVPGEARLAIASSAPTPFTHSTAFSFENATGAAIDLLVFDVSGRVVRRLVGVPGPDGRGVVTWDGRDDRGRSVGSGVYFARASEGSRSAVTRTVLLR
jgi:hypothetical protein